MDVIVNFILKGKYQKTWKLSDYIEDMLSYNNSNDYLVSGAKTNYRETITCMES